MDMKLTVTRRAATALVSAASVLAFAATTMLAQGPWKEYKDFTGLTTPAGGGRAGATPPATPPSTNPAERGWKIENGVFIAQLPVPQGQRSGGIATTDKFYDFEIEFDYQLGEHPTAKCTAALGDKPNAQGVVQKEANLSEPGCGFNSGVSFRNGYQLNLGRREAGEYIGLVIHREVPWAIRTQRVAWLSTGDCGAKNNAYLQDCSQFPEIRKKGDWNSVRLSAKGPRIQAWLNGKQIVDVTDNANPTLSPDNPWKDPSPISFQFPPAGEAGGFDGFVKYRNIRFRTL
jgi:hypothetical protein